MKAKKIKVDQQPPPHPIHYEVGLLRVNGSGRFVSNAKDWMLSLSCFLIKYDIMKCLHYQKIFKFNRFWIITIPHLLCPDSPNGSIFTYQPHQHLQFIWGNFSPVCQDKNHYFWGFHLHIIKAGRNELHRPSMNTWDLYTKRWDHCQRLRIVMWILLVHYHLSSYDSRK